MAVSPLRVLPRFAQRQIMPHGLRVPATLRIAKVTQLLIERGTPSFLKYRPVCEHTMAARQPIPCLMVMDGVILDISVYRSRGGVRGGWRRGFTKCDS